MNDKIKVELGSVQKNIAAAAHGTGKGVREARSAYQG